MSVSLVIGWIVIFSFAAGVAGYAIGYDKGFKKANEIEKAELDRFAAYLERLKK